MDIFLFLSGFCLAFGGFFYLVYKAIKSEKTGDDDELFNLQEERKGNFIDKTTCGNNIRRK